MPRITASAPDDKTNRLVRRSLNWRAMGWLLLLAIIAAAGLMLKSPTAPARARAFCPPGEATLRPDPPGTIDGAKNPELIPDGLAYRILFLSLVEPENPTAQQQARQEAKLRMMDLSADDKAAFLGALGEFRGQINELDAQVKQIHKVTPIPLPDSTDSLKLADLKNQQDAVFAAATASLKSRLSMGGEVKLQVHLGNVKCRIKTIPKGMAIN